MKLSRIAEISKVFLEEGFATVSEGEGGEPAPDVQRAVRLRRALERLGPTFVKFGQVLGTRVDLFEEDVLRELRKLRAQVPPFSFEEAQRILCEELDAPVDEVFEAFPEDAIASASIAQVYRARLRSTGVEVAVKVQRPGLEQSLLLDLDVLMQVSGFVDKLVPAYRRSMVHRVAAEYATRARQEIDFLAEARAMEQFHEVVATLPEFRVPRVFSDHSTSRVLVMEWLDGVLLDRVEDVPALVKAGQAPYGFASAMLRLQLSMSYEHGLVHGDTHPGNIILLPSGRIGLIDFGLHGQVPRQLCDKMLELLHDQSCGRTDDAVSAFLQVFIPHPDVDLTGFEAELREVLDPRKTTTAVESRMTAQLIEGLRVGARYQLQARSELFVVLRNLTIVEGIVLQFCPSLELMPEVRKITGEILQRRALAANLGREARDVLPMLLLTLSQRPRLADRLLRLERSFNESQNLGEFLRREGVVHAAPQTGPGPWTWVGIGGLGMLVGVMITWWVLTG